MELPVLAVCVGLAALVFGADRFVLGAAACARHLGMPPLLIGMVVVGFGTSAPELVVSALAAADGTPGLALGNAYGSNITNIGLILGVTAVMSPIAVHSTVLRKELPILVAITAMSAALVVDGEVSRTDAVILLIAFACVMGWSIWQGFRHQSDSFGKEVKVELTESVMPLRTATLWLGLGLVLLVSSSRLLVWGAVEIAHSLGISDLVIGLTVVAVGTSLPELASSVIAGRKGEHDIALGNILGSNLFNTLAVVGLAGVISPLGAGPEVFSRDFLVMGVLTLSIFVFGFGFRGPGRINRLEGMLLMIAYGGYTAYLLVTST
jgi:cation:H+ antiporter